MANDLLKKNLFATTLLASAAGGIWSGAAIAQEDDAVTVIEEVDSGDESRQETVVITGSRIARPEIDTVFPTISTDAELLDKGAFTNVADALNQIPAFGGGIDPLGDQGANIGVNFVDFLDLGTQRTLTLVNGRRFVSQNSAGTGQQVDFSIIPLPLVERIDTIGVGGAPIYGSDAIAGTINVILKDDFEGLEILGQLDRSEAGDAESQTIQLVAGANTSDGRGNVTFSAEYFNSEGLLQTDRPDIYIGELFFSESGSGRDIDGDGEDDSFFEPFTGGQNVQLFTNGGVIAPSNFFIPSIGAGGFGANGFFQFAPNGNLVPLEPGTSIPGTSVFFAEGGFENDFFAEVDQIRSPVERITFGSTFNYDLFDNVRATADVIFANTESIELIDQGGFQTFAFDGFSDGLTIPVTNPFFNTQAQGVLATLGFDLSPGSTDTVSVQRFNNDIIDSANGSESTTWRIAGGLDGDFSLADREFRWDVSMNAGQFTNENFGTLINDRRFLLALDARQLTAADITALGGPVNNLGASEGDIVCNSTFQFETGTAAERTAILEAQGLVGFGIEDSAPVDITQCQPLNIFGEGAPSAAALEYVVGQESTNNDIDQSVFTANFGGELFDLPGGTVAFNVGYETRRETANFQPAAANEVGLGRGAETPRTGGSYSTDEVYGEILVPIISPDMEIPYLYDAQIEGSYRNIDNSLAGEAEAWTVGFKLSPIEGLQFRGNATESLRAPSLDELFSPITTSFQFADDPCDNRFINDRPNFQANCIAAGVRTDADGDGVADGVFTSNVANATARGRAGGNPNLANETSEAFTIGFVYEPTFVDNLIIKADWIDIRIDDLIQAFDLETIMQTCFDAAPGSFPNDFCGSFRRDANGQVVDFLTGQTNADFLEAEFLQLDVTYSFDVADAIALVGAGERGDWGNLEVDFSMFQVMNRDSETAGVFNNSGDNGVGGFADPRTSGLVDFTWDRGPARLFWRVIWQDDALASTTGDNLFVDLNGNRVEKTDAHFMNNMSFSYDLSALMDSYDNPLIAQIGVNNVFDQKASDDPIRRALGDFTNSDVLGRTYSLRLRAVF
ncbi:MAG: TonB-dependent receptor [Pseudomonadota bacterium]